MLHKNVTPTRACGLPPTKAALFSLAAMALLLGGCGTERSVVRPTDISTTLRADLPAAAPKPTVVPSSVSNALAEPAAAPVKPTPEPRIDLLVNNAPARDVFLAIVADTRYSMLMHPDVSGTLSVTLRGVTVSEALESIRDVYGYDFKIDGRRITIYAPTLQTRIFTVNYPNSKRQGSSDLNVSPGRATTAQGGSGGGGNSAGAPNANSSNSNSVSNTTSSVSTRTQNDMWAELKSALVSIVGDGQGRNVVVSPNAGVIAVRAMPDELRQVDKFLRAMQMSVERQVMLEAKVVEVELSDGFQSGVNWSGLNASGGNTLNVGVIGTGSSTASNAGSSVPSALAQGTQNIISGVVPSPASAAGGGLFGLALATTNFNAVLGFLETQGDVQTLSNPRVATLNNQKAVLKVGSDNYYVTAISGGSSTASTGTTAATNTLPTVELSPFFSGISLDVTPQVDEANNVTLHVHPAVSVVTEKTQTVGIGSLGSYSLPVASTNVNETDTMVRIQDGQIVAIGGLMQLATSRNQSGLPGTTNLGAVSSLFGNRALKGAKREVIVLIKPTIIRTAADWEEQGRKARAALDDMDEARARLIQLDGVSSK